MRERLNRTPEPELVRTLRTWADAGAQWQVVSLTEGQVTVALLRCDGGEEVERITSTDPAAVAYLRDVTT